MDGCWRSMKTTGYCVNLSGTMLTSTRKVWSKYPKRGNGNENVEIALPFPKGTLTLHEENSRFSKNTRSTSKSKAWQTDRWKNGRTDAGSDPYVLQKEPLCVFSEGPLTLLLLAMFPSRHHDLFLWTIQLSKILLNRKQLSQRKLNWSSDKQLSSFLQSDKHQMLTVLTTKSWQCIQAVTATFLYNGTWR